MPSFEILLDYRPDGGDTFTVEDVVAQMNSAINDHGLLGGNFLVRLLPEDGGAAFWAEWSKRTTS